jgi:glutamate--cysteine ligase
VEASLRPEMTVSGIEKAYHEVCGELKSLLAKDQALALLGYHPRTRIGELPLLPKERYRMMYDYFGGRGRYARHMMKGTAATQVSIDYRDEADFIKKFRVANFLAPFIARIFDSTPVFEGEIYQGENCRILIWANTDPDRSKLVPGSLDRMFGFADYTDYLLRTPPIIAHVNGRAVFTGNEKLGDLLERFDFVESDYPHLLSMVFPDVRLKSFIEIRMADALPYPYNMAVPALIKGIFYHPINLDRYFELSQSFSDEDIHAINARLVHATDFSYKDLNINDFSLALIENAESALDQSESSYLAPLKALMLKDGSMAKKLKKLYLDRPQEFMALITL